MAADWQKIKLEYVTTDIGYRALAEKYGIPITTLAERGCSEKWVDLRKQFRDETQTKMLDAFTDQMVDTAKKYKEVTERMLNLVASSLESAQPEKVTAKEIRAFTSAVKDLGDILGIRNDLDLEEQTARIANLRRQANQDEPKPITLIVEGLPEEFKT